MILKFLKAISLEFNNQIPPEYIKYLSISLSEF